MAGKPTKAGITVLHSLKRSLQAASSGALEKVAAAAVGQILGVPFFVAKSGFQSGGDAGTAGLQGRHVRLEAKRYADKTPLGERELQGEIDDAVRQDPALEAWILVATRGVPEQVAITLRRHGEEKGISVLIVDWPDERLSLLAAICSQVPEIIEAQVSKDAAAAAREVAKTAGPEIERFRQELQSWRLGFEGIRRRSHETLREVWESRRQSEALMGQDIAGGERSRAVSRRSVHAALNAWWDSGRGKEAVGPALVTGLEGVGKTWAAANWLLDQANRLPIVLLMPASSVDTRAAVTPLSAKRILAGRLQEIANTARDADFWLRRVERLLQRPLQEGPVIILLVDGLNQASSVQWESMLKALQASEFAGRVRVIATTRTFHLDDRLRSLRGLQDQAIRIEVAEFGIDPGGELDQALSAAGLSRSALHPDLLKLARVPRLFQLVLALRDKFTDVKSVTAHRLLWEYGRDSFGTLSGRAFSADDWEEWLRSIATDWRNGVREFSSRRVAELTARLDRSVDDLFARISDLVDGALMGGVQAGRTTPTREGVTHALGLALIDHLSRHLSAAPEAVQAQVIGWLDPISGLDERAEILRAAVSIGLCCPGRLERTTLGVLLTAWLQSQNLDESHEDEIQRLAAELVEELLIAIEGSTARVHVSARIVAVNALRSLRRESGPALDAISRRATTWLGNVSRGRSAFRLQNPDHEKARSRRLTQLLGVDSDTSLTVLRETLRLVEHHDGTLQATIPSIIEGFPLAGLVPLFRRAALASVVAENVDPPDHVWKGMLWLSLFNEVDPTETADALRTEASRILEQGIEPGVHPSMPGLVAKRLFRLTGVERDDETASRIETRLDGSRSYEDAYLRNPARSLFRLERRHALDVLRDNASAVDLRVDRCRELWADPTFEPPPEFIEDLRREAPTIEVQELWCSRSPSHEDHRLERLAPALARCAPVLLADVVRGTLSASKETNGESRRYWLSYYGLGAVLLANAPQQAAARVLRLSGCEKDQDNEALAASGLLALELRDAPTVRQWATVIEAELPYVCRFLLEALRSATPDETDELVARFREDGPERREMLTALLACNTSGLGQTACKWLLSVALESDGFTRGAAFRALATHHPVDLGRALFSAGWRWDPEAHHWTNHFGSLALIEGTKDLPFEELLNRLDPSTILVAARARGAKPSDVQLAADLLDRLLRADTGADVDPGVQLMVDRRKPHAGPFVVVDGMLTDEDGEPRAGAALLAALEDEARERARTRAVKIAAERIREAMNKGAKLLLAKFEADDLALVLQHSPTHVDAWLDGMTDLTSRFARQVRSGEGLFIALCEALLRCDADRGTALWRALRRTVRTRYVGEAGVEEFIHMLFRVPDSEAVHALRIEAASPARSPSDLALYELVTAAACNDRRDWIMSIAVEDDASAFAWRKRRAIVLRGFAGVQDLPVADAWPEGPHVSVYGEMRERAGKWLSRAASARHWWQALLAALSEEDAYAAWTLFLNSVDHRALAWMSDEVQTANRDDDLFRIICMHIGTNTDDIEREMKRKRDKLSKSYLGWEPVEGVGPWGKVGR